ncbi:carbohydrate ABC transporter permease [Paenibacillus sp. CAU 1782]
MLRGLVYHLSVGLLAFAMLYPVLWMFASSFKSNQDIFQNSHILIPQVWQFENYTSGWAGFGGITFATFFKNSFIIAIVSTIGAVASSAMVAYAFARIPFRFKGFWFGCMMMTMMLPGDVTIIPQYVMFNSLDWISTFKPIIVPAFFGAPFFIFLIIQFIRTIPSEMDEAAKIDGCSKFGIFYRIIVPLIIPAMTTAAIFSFYWRWDDFLGPLLYLNKPAMYPVSLALKLFLDSQSYSEWGSMFAMSCLSLVPVLLIFFLFQRYIVEGISTSGLKG